MHFEINVSLNGKHLFATDPRSLPSERDARALLDLFSKKFPADDGFELRLTRWDTTGTRLDEPSAPILL